MDTIINGLETILGINAESNLTVWQILARCIVIYVLGIALVRFGKKRFLGKLAAFDTILAIIIGSLLSRAITDADMFLKICAAASLLILLHRLFSLVAAFSHSFGTLIKGNPVVVVKDGEMLKDAMHKSNLSENDLMQALRLNGSITDVKEAKKATLERNGDISVLKN